MKKNSFFIILGTLAVILIVAGVIYKRLAPTIDTPSVLNEPTSTASKAEPSDTASSLDEAKKYPAPDFEFQDADGEMVKFSDFKGTPVVANFWASWCGPCVVEMPYFQDAYDEYSSDGSVTMLMVNLTSQREPKEDADAFITEKGFTFPIYYDINQQSLAAYNLTSIPFTVFVDSNGDIVTYARGMLQEEDLQKGFDMLFEKEEALKNAA